VRFWRFGDSAAARLEELKPLHKATRRTNTPYFFTGYSPLITTE
jgi:hypothetical protein